MQTTKAKQAVVVPSTSINPHKRPERLELFDTTGAPIDLVGSIEEVSNIMVFPGSAFIPSGGSPSISAYGAYVLDVDSDEVATILPSCWPTATHLEATFYFRWSNAHANTDGSLQFSISQIGGAIETDSLTMIANTNGTIAEVTLIADEESQIKLDEPISFFMTLVNSVVGDVEVMSYGLKVIFS